MMRRAPFIHRALFIRALFIPCALAAALTFSAPAMAQDDDLRAKARQLAAEGGELYQNDDFGNALSKLDEAYRILRVPTLGFYSGRCLEQLGRWVEAAERYREVGNMALPEKKRELHAEARESARQARVKLLPRIPRLRVKVTVDDPSATEGDAGGESDFAVSVDGRTLSNDYLGDPIPVDPGEHVVVANRGSDRVEEKVVLVEGKDLTAELRLVITPPLAPLPSDVPPPAPKTVVIDNSGYRTAGFVTLGIGGAMALGGVVAGAVLLAEGASLDDVCIEEACQATAEVGAYNALRPTTTVLLAAGGAAVAVGLVFVLAFPDGERQVPPGGDVGTEVKAVISPGFVGLRGRF